MKKSSALFKRLNYLTNKVPARVDYKFQLPSLRHTETYRVGLQHICFQVGISFSEIKVTSESGQARKYKADDKSKEDNK